MELGCYYSSLECVNVMRVVVELRDKGIVKLYDVVE